MIHPGQGYALPEYPFVAAGDWRDRISAPSHRHRRRRHHRADAGLRAARYGVEAVLLDEDNTVGVKGASSRGICYAQIAGDLRPPGRLRPDCGQGRAVERGPHLRGRRRGLQLRPAPAEHPQLFQPAAVHQHPAVLHRGLPGRTDHGVGPVDLRWQ